MNMSVMVYEDRQRKWHLIRSLAKEGLGITTKAYCEHSLKGGEVQQLPDKFMKKLCAACQKEFKVVEKSA